MLLFSKNVKFLRIQKGCTQAQMADSIEFNRTTWNGYETGKSFPKFEDLVRIAEIFNISESDLIHADLSEGAPIDSVKKYKATETSLLKAKDEIIESLKQTIAAQNTTITTLTEEVKRLKKK